MYSLYALCINSGVGIFLQRSEIGTGRLVPLGILHGAQLRDPSNLSDITVLWYKERFIILWYIEGFIKEGPYYLFMNIYIIY